MTITKIFEFCASHKLYNPNWDEAKNFAVFGKCANKNGHGHNYTMEVSVCGEVDPESGMIMNAMDLSAIVKETIVAQLDHKNLNLDIPWLQGKIPTVEVVLNEVWLLLDEILKTSYPQVELFKIKLWETSKIFACKYRD